ncbi:TonB-dependent receptor [Novosphingobium sp. 11B]
MVLNRSQFIGAGGLTSLVFSLHLASPAFAQSALTDAAVGAATERGEDIVVTGSRIRRSATETSAPIIEVGSDELIQRGYVQAGEALNTVSSIRPSFAQAPGNGNPAGDGQQFPDIFGLGAGRTLTLVNGRRMVTTSSGLGDRVVDTNIIPTGLLRRIDITQAGGAAVYGSDAIAGVINYVLENKFDGVQLDLQSGITSRGDYPRRSVAFVAGRNFSEGRGNIAIDLEYRKTDPLLFDRRPITNPVFRLFTNPLNQTPSDGIPSRAPINDPRFWVQNEPGVIFSEPAPVSDFVLSQFSNDGRSIIPFNMGRPPVPGFNCPIPFCSGGDGYPYAKLQALYSGVETLSGNVVGHYDITPDVTLSTELNYAHRKATDPLGSQAPQLSVLGGNPIAFTRDNPYLTPDAVSTLSALSPGFAAGESLYLSKSLDALVPTRAFTYENDVYRGVLALDGRFRTLDRDFNFAVSFSHAQISGRNSGYAAVDARLANAVDVARNSSGQIVCAVNAIEVVDPQCSPINPFGNGNISDAARAYATAPTGADYRNRQDDLIATLGGDIMRLPAGPAKFSLTYEHRGESARFTPFEADQNGSFNDSYSPPTGGQFNTDEFAAEVLLPLIAPEMQVPFVQRLEVEGQYRLVDHSVAGRAQVWGAGARWEPGFGLALRLNRSRNFRAPTLDQLYAPRSTVLQGGINDPCDARFLNSGVSVPNRIANCQSLFAANPQWGPLATFTDPAVNFDTALVTSGGNTDLSNEVSDTFTYGLVWQPSYVPGILSIGVDRIQIDLKGGLTAFTPTNFAEACFDASPQPADICAAFRRDPATGYIVSARSTTFNAALLQYRGYVINGSYRFPLSWLANGKDAGTLELSVDATHNQRLRTTVSGVTTEQAGTTVSPDWVLRADVRYHIGRFGLTYEVYYLPKTKINRFDTIENTPFPIVPSNTRHSLSAVLDLDNIQLRAGVNNFTDRGPSRSTVLNYGDIIGRQFFVGARLKLK